MPRTVMATALLVVGFVVCALAQSGVAWTYRYNGTGNGDDQPLAAFVDDTGNVYVVGWTHGATTGLDVFVLKLDSLGRKVWVSTYDNGQSDEDVAVGAARDASGNLYVVAGVSSDSGRGEVCLLKYAPSGALVWQRAHGETGRSWAPGAGVCFDSAQNIYVCGTRDSTTVRIVQYSPEGSLLGTRSYTASGYRAIYTLRFHLLADGSAILAISAEHPVRSSDWLIVRLSPQGQVLWEQVFRPTGTRFERLKWSEVADDGSICLTGEVCSPTSGSNDIGTMKIDSAGNVLWVAEYNGPENQRDDGMHVLPAGGYCYVAGATEFPSQVGNPHAIVLIKYDSVGSKLWARTYGRADTSCHLGYFDPPNDDRPAFSAVCGDGAGLIYIAGGAYIGSRPIGENAWVAIVVKCNSLGNLSVARLFEVSAAGSFHGAAAILDGHGKLCLVGVIGWSGTWDVFVTKFDGR